MIRKIFACLMVASMVLLSACNNKLAAADGEHGKPSTWGDVAYTTTYAEALETCAAINQGVLGIAKNGTPTCGGPVGTAFWLNTGSVDLTGCPTRAEANEMLKAVNENGPRLDLLVEVSAEKSAWQFNTGDPNWSYSITLPESTQFVASMHLKGEDKAKVFYGDGKTYEVWRGTFRFSGCYSADDDMNQERPWERILIKENFDGSVQEWANGSREEDWTYSLLPGNFTCTLFECPTSNAAGNQTSNLSNSAPSNCPTFAGVQTVAKNDDGPYCKLFGSTKLTGTVPAGWKVDYWTGTQTLHANAGEQISLYEATFRAVK